MHLAADQGAVNATQDAMALANFISNLHSKSVEDLAEVFKAYRVERRLLARESYRTSQTSSKTIEKVTGSSPDVIYYFSIFFTAC